MIGTDHQGNGGGDPGTPTLSSASTSPPVAEGIVAEVQRRWQDAAFLVAGLALTILDAAATHLWLGLGIAEEANPFVLRIIDSFGVGTAMGLRALIGSVLLISLFAVAPHARLARPAFVGALLVLATVAVVHLQGVVLVATA